MCTGVDAELLSAVLAAFAEQVGAGEGKLVILSWSWTTPAGTSAGISSSRRGSS